MTSSPYPSPDSVTISLNRDVFLRTLVRDLAGTLENVVGLEEASGFISVVGQRIGEWIDAEYRQALATSIDTLKLLKKADRGLDVERFVDDRYIREAYRQAGLDYQAALAAMREGLAVGRSSDTLAPAPQGI